MIGMFYADIRSGLTLISTYSFDDSFAICVSMAMLRVNGHEDDLGAHVLICGLRNGTIRTFRIHRGTQPSKSSWGAYAPFIFLFQLCPYMTVLSTSISASTLGFDKEPGNDHLCYLVTHSLWPSKKLLMRSMWFYVFTLQATYSNVVSVLMSAHNSKTLTVRFTKNQRLSLIKARC